MEELLNPERILDGISGEFIFQEVQDRILLKNFF